MQRTRHLLDYVATHPDAILSYAKSDMILGIHRSYLSEPTARSRASGHFFLSNGTDEALNNGAILNISQIIKSVMSSAAEAELGALYINAREAVPVATRPRYPRTIPIFLAPRHNQPRRLLDKAPLQRPPPRKTNRNPHTTIYHPSTARLHQQVPSNLRKRYHADDQDRSKSSLITTTKLEIPKGCARYPQVSILGIWNSHVESVSLTLAKLACAFWHTLVTKFVTHHKDQQSLFHHAHIVTR
jgi:hypothetical protein